MTGSGFCAVCQLYFALTVRGNLVRHGQRHCRCPATGRTPDDSVKIAIVLAKRRYADIVCSHKMSEEVKIKLLTRLKLRMITQGLQVDLDAWWKDGGNG